MNKPLANEAMQDQALVKQMRALEQAEPSAELDAAILQQIEAALREEANVNSQAQANSKSSTENRETSAPITSLTAAPTWFDRLRQWWYLPFAAMASLVLAVNLMPSDSTDTHEMSVPTIAKTETGTPPQAKIDPITTPQNSEGKQADSDDMFAKTRRIASSDANYGRSRSKQDRHLSRGATGNAKDAQSTQNVTIALEKSASPAPVAIATLPTEVAETRVLTKEVSVANKERLASNATLPTAPGAADTPKVAEVRTIQVTGSRIQAVSNEASSVALKEDTLGKIAPEAKIAPPVLMAAPPMPQEPRPTIAPLPVTDTKELALPKPMVSPPENTIQAIIESEKKDAKTISSNPKQIRKDIEQLLSEFKEQEALLMWHAFKKQYPQQSLPAALEKRLQNLEKQHSEK